MQRNVARGRISRRCAKTLICLVIGSISPVVSLAWEVSTATVGAGKPYLPDTVIVPIDDDHIVTLGEGVDLLTGQRRQAFCVNSAGEIRTQLGNQDSAFEQVVDENSLIQKLNVSVSAKGKYAGFSGGGSYSRSVETRTKSKNIYAVLQAAIREYAMGLKIGEFPTGTTNPLESGIDLTTAARNLLTNSPLRFRQVCGDGYVSQIVWGSDFYAVFEFGSLDYFKKESISGSLNFATPGDVFSADAKTEASEEIKKLRETTKISVVQRGAGLGQFATTQAELTELYRKFPETTKGRERPLYATVVRYSTLASGKEQEQFAMIGNLALMAQSEIRLRTLLVDVDEAIAERQAAVPVEQRLYVTLKGDAERRLLGLEKTRNEILAARKLLQEQIRTCLVKQDNVACKYDAVNADIEKEFIFRARAPLPINGVDPAKLKGMAAFILASETDPNEANPIANAVKCEMAALVFEHNILRPSNVRCDKADQCVDQEFLNRGRKAAYEAIGKLPIDCGIQE